MYLISPQVLGQYYKAYVRQITIDVTPAVVLPGNPSRWSIFWGAPEPSVNYQFWPGQIAATNDGIIYFTNVLQPVIAFPVWGPVVGWDWWAASAGGPVNIQLIEVLFTPPSVNLVPEQ